MINKLELTIKEIVIIVSIPIILAAVFDISYEYLLLVYTLITISLSHYDIVTMDHSDYGEKIYKRTYNMCQIKCIVTMILMQLSLYIVFTMIQLNPLYYALVVSAVMMSLIRRQFLLVMYTKGIKYHGKFYSFEVLKDGHLVKNYKEMYEIYLEHKKIELNATELTLAFRNG